jgi:hypothetical protein
MCRRICSLLRREDGVAVATAIMVTLAMMLMITGVIANAVHSNDATTLDRHKEDGFQAASAGIDNALDCLGQLGSGAALSTCSKAADATTILTDAGTTIGQYGYAITDITPVGQTVRVAKVTSTGEAPSYADPRSTRYVTVEVSMVPVGGFFDTIFAGSGGTLASKGLASFKNNATVNGNAYAGTYDVQKNNNSILDLRVVGDVTTKNNDSYKSIWSGGSLTLTNNTAVQTTAKACGAAGSPGNATLNSGASVGGNLQYKGTLSNSGTVGSTTHAACTAPTTLDVPSYTYSAANYPGWTIVAFSSAVLANACLATAGSTQAVQQAACGGQALGDANATIGKNGSGTLVYVNATSPCGTTVSLGSATYTGNFTLVTTCPMSLGGTLTKSAAATGNKQAIFIAADPLTTATTGTNLDPNGLTSSSTSLSVLLYATGTIGTGNAPTIAAGSIYGRIIDLKNSLSITASTDLGANAPLGFTFDPSVASTFTPVMRDWRESAS